MTAATTPATDEQIDSFERVIGSSSIMSIQGYEKIVLSLIARIHQEREKAIRECAEVARVVCDDDEDYGRASELKDAILALLPTPPALSQEELT